jgi:hypothetical protein
MWWGCGPEKKNYDLGKVVVFATILIVLLLAVEMAAIWIVHPLHLIQKSPAAVTLRGQVLGGKPPNVGAGRS